MWQHRVEPVKRWCSKARTEAVIQEIFRARGWHLDFEANRWIIQVPEPYPVVVFNNLWLLVDQEIVCFLMICGLVSLWFQFLATNISTFLIPNNIGFFSHQFGFVFVWKTLVSPGHRLAPKPCKGVITSCTTPGEFLSSWKTRCKNDVDFSKRLGFPLPSQ